jgi:hypothetical protein
MSNCPCDEFIFPAELRIPSGLVQLNRQIATFPDFRRALLARIPAYIPLREWRARDLSDFGLMLLEMWAVLADSVSFYDEVIAHELYLRTARLRPSVRKLTGLLGYVPRPASSSSVVLAATADGRIAVDVPAGSGFRSGAFAGNPPQVFETSADRIIHPAFNSWAIALVRPDTFPPDAPDQDFILAESGSVSAKPGDFVLLVAGTGRSVLQVKAVTSYQGADGAAYSKVSFTTPSGIPAGASVAAARLFKPAAFAGLWKQPGTAVFSERSSVSFLQLNGLYRQIRSGDYVLVGRGTDLRWFQILYTEEIPAIVTESATTETTDANGNVISRVTSPPVTALVTRIALDALVSTPGRGVSGQPYVWDAGDTNVTVNYTMIEAARIVLEAKSTLSANDPLQVAGRANQPADITPPGNFLLEDAAGRGVEVNGTLNFASGTLTLSQGAVWDPALTAPVTAYGNLLKATRGESVKAEFLGTGDATQASQTFQLKKKPLSYVPSPVPGNLTGVASTLSVYVDGVRWREVPSFFGIGPADQVYQLRQDDDSNTLVTLNRLRTGSTVSAWYRYGAEAAAPPAGSITQPVRPVDGLRSIRNPVPAAGGSDAEDAEGIRTFAPRSALLLGRAISIPDLEAAASIQPGVRSASAGWLWNREAQSPVIQIFYIGDESIHSQVAQTLRGLTDSVTPIRVDRATPVVRSLTLDVLIDDRYFQTDVLAQIRLLLLEPVRGLLTPERLGVNATLFRSVLFEEVLSIPGVLAVRGFSMDGFAPAQFGVRAGTGKYFDFETGGLILNGEAA